MCVFLCVCVDDYISILNYQFPNSIYNITTCLAHSHDHHHHVDATTISDDNDDDPTTGNGQWQWQQQQH